MKITCEKTLSIDLLAKVLTYLDHEIILNILRTDLIMTEECGRVEDNLASLYERKTYVWLETLIQAAYKAVRLNLNGWLATSYLVILSEAETRTIE